MRYLPSVRPWPVQLRFSPRKAQVLHDGKGVLDQGSCNSGANRHAHRTSIKLGLRHMFSVLAKAVSTLIHGPRRSESYYLESTKYKQGFTE